MIERKGYYLSSASYYEDQSPGGFRKEGWISTAFQFLKNGIVKRAGKNLLNEHHSYNISDFELAYEGEYSIKGATLEVIFDKGKDWELRSYYRIERDGVVCIKTNGHMAIGQVLSFFSW